MAKNLVISIVDENGKVLDKKSIKWNGLSTIEAIRKIDSKHILMEVLCSELRDMILNVISIEILGEQDDIS